MRVAILAFVFVTLAAQAQVYNLKAITAKEVSELDRQKTIVLLPDGILEEHGPFLPVYSDGYGAERLTAELADALVEKGYSVLVFPPIPLGNGGANIIGRKYSFSGTFAVRYKTLRAVFMDLADEIGNQGFRKVFIISSHGAPNCNRALDEAGDYFQDTYGGFMVNLNGLMALHEAGTVNLTPEQAREEGFSVHAGVNETSEVLFVVPQLVQKSYLNAVPQSGSDFSVLVKIAEREGWPGYFGSPRMATASQGAVRWKGESAAAIDLAARILNGADHHAMPHYVEITQKDPASLETDSAALRHENEAERQQQMWLTKRHLDK
ncbi:MAG TPA: creatininase family protein [Candidatus Angelobacter sp.]|nr:creatininase family protein [Candidatus Angelobacter sp.]